MNYWPRWINSVRKRTAGLSLAEMGAYDRLLDHYYAEEQPLPADLEECCRLAVAMTKDERRAVEKVLVKFFTLGQDGYRNERADEEIALALPKIAAAKANGAKGGRRPGKPKEPSGLPGGLRLGTQGQPGGQAPHPQQQINTITEHPTDAGGGALAGAIGEFEPNQIINGYNPTAAGLLCRELRLAGIADVNPGHPRLLALLEAGAQTVEFTGFAPSALAKSPRSPFSYLLGMVEGERQRATATAGQLRRGPLPNRQEAIEQRNAAVGDAWLAQQGAA